jgi:hypothetical protein
MSKAESVWRFAFHIWHVYNSIQCVFAIFSFQSSSFDTKTRKTLLSAAPTKCRAAELVNGNFILLVFSSMFRGTTPDMTFSSVAVSPAANHKTDSPQLGSCCDTALV